MSIASSVVLDRYATFLKSVVMNVSRFVAVDPYLDVIIYAFDSIVVPLSLKVAVTCDRVEFL